MTKPIDAEVEMIKTYLNRGLKYKKVRINDSRLVGIVSKLTVYKEMLAFPRDCVSSVVIGYYKDRQLKGLITSDKKFLIKTGEHYNFNSAGVFLHLYNTSGLSIGVEGLSFNLGSTDGKNGILTVVGNDTVITVELPENSFKIVNS